MSSHTTGGFREGAGGGVRALTPQGFDRCPPKNVHPLN